MKTEVKDLVASTGSVDR